MPHKLHHHCGGHCWRTQEGDYSILSTTRYAQYLHGRLCNLQYCCHRMFVTVYHIGSPNVTVSVLSSTSVHLTWLSLCNTQQYSVYYRGTCGTYLDEGRFSTDQQQYTFDGLQEGINYTFTVNQTGFGETSSAGPMYITSLTAGIG